MQRLEVSGAVRPIYGSLTHIWVVRRQTVNMYLVINKCVTVLILSNLSRYYFHNCSTSNRRIFGCIDVISPNDYSKKYGRFLLKHPVYCFNENRMIMELEMSCREAAVTYVTHCTIRLRKITQHLSQYSTNEHTQSKFTTSMLKIKTYI